MYKWSLEISLKLINFEPYWLGVVWTSAEDEWQENQTRYVCVYPIQKQKKSENRDKFTIFSYHRFKDEMREKKWVLNVKKYILTFAWSQANRAYCLENLKFFRGKTTRTFSRGVLFFNPGHIPTRQLLSFRTPAKLVPIHTYIISTRNYSRNDVIGRKNN